MTEVVLVLVSIAFLVTLGILLFGRKSAALPAKVSTPDDVRIRQLEADLDKRKKELEEHKKTLNETKDELKQAKKKLYDQKESGKSVSDLAKARAEVERNASMQLEIVRGELAAAQVEIDRLKSEKSGGRRVGTVTTPTATTEPVAAAPVAVQPSAPAAEPEKPKRVIRELSDADKERMERLERDAKKARDKQGEAERELKRLKGRLETDKRVYVVTKGELDLIKDKYKALEKRMNRTLLANDLLKRAIKDLEKKTGISAERIDPTAEELADSDQQTEARVNAEAAKDAERHAENLRAAEEAGRRAAEASEASTPSSTEAAEPAAAPSAATASAEPTSEPSAPEAAAPEAPAPTEPERPTEPTPPTGS